MVKRTALPLYLYYTSIAKKKALKFYFAPSRRLRDATPRVAGSPPSRVAGSPRSRIAAKTENGQASLLFSSAYLYLLANI